MRYRSYERDNADLKTVLVGALFVIVIAALICLAVREDREWQAFKADHHCKVSKKVDGDLVPIFSVGPDGQVTTSIAATSGKTCWVCDDGVEYCR